MQHLPVPLQVRLIFIITIICLVAQTAFISEFGEPYPSITFPGFPGSGGYQDGHVEIVRFEAVFVSNEIEHIVPAKLLLAEFPDSFHTAIGQLSLQPRANLTSEQPRSRLGKIRDSLFPGFALRSPAALNSPATLDSLRSWLQRRAEALFPKHSVSRVEIRWFREKIQVDQGKLRSAREPIDTFTLEMLGESA